MKIEEGPFCRNYADPTYLGECLGAPDPRYTMDFSDIGEPPIYWCSACGPEAQEVEQALAGALAGEDGPEVADILRDMIEEAELAEGKN